MLTACQRLLQHASAIKQSVDLTGASIAIDDCYELWESGFISIPYDFEVSELQPQLQKLLAAGSARAAADDHAATTAAGEGSSDEGEEEVVVAMEGAEFDLEQEDGFIAAASRRQGVVCMQAALMGIMLLPAAAEWIRRPLAVAVVG